MPDSILSVVRVTSGVATNTFVYGCGFGSSHGGGITVD